LREARYRLVLGALLWAAAVRAQPPAQLPAPAPAPAGHTQPPAPPASQDVPDEEFIEFLGEDDHGDAAWSEFLKRAQHGAQNPTPPQGAKQS
jgi:hypothetical protein